MATRSGDVDPTIPLYLQQHCGLSAADVDRMLNKQSGFKGLCDLTDLRAITMAGTPQAQLALDVSVRAFNLAHSCATCCRNPRSSAELVPRPVFRPSMWTKACTCANRMTTVTPRIAVQSVHHKPDFNNHLRIENGRSGTR